jgi:cobalt-zinc-cadmium resistance protein CzcA
MRLTGVSLSLLSIGALDFGIIVDGAIVMVERVVRRLSEREPENRSGVVATIRAAVLEVQRPIFFSLCILIAAYIPLLTLERVESRLFTPMALTVCYALLGALLMAFTLVPALACWLLRAGVKHRRNLVLDWLDVQYGRLLARTVGRAGWTAAVASVIVGGALYFGTRLGTEFLPHLDEGVIWIRSNLPPGISLAKSAETAARMRDLILHSPEVKTVMSQTGRNDDGTDPFGPNRIELLIDLHPYHTWKTGKRKADLVEELSQRLRAEIPGATFNFTQPIIDTSTEIATGSSADLAVIISGPDLKPLRALAQQTLVLLQELPGAVDTSIEQEADQPQLRIHIDRSQIARYGINVADVQDMIDLALGGRPIARVFEEERRFDVAARFTAESRADHSAVGDLLIPTAAGSRIPLSQLADIQMIDGPSIILRHNNERAIAVRTNIRGRDQGGFVADAQARFAAAVKLPSGYHVVWGGQFENLERARRHLTIIIPVTIGVIFALLFITFGSTRDAFIVLLNVPFSLAGGLIALELRGMHLTVSAAVGFIALFGVAVMSGLLYISAINRLRAEPNMPLYDAVLLGARTQFRPRLILILVAMLAMIPASVATGIGSDIQRPLATVIVGGLMSTLVLTLFALPSVYYLMARVRSTPAGNEEVGC